MAGRRGSAVRGRRPGQAATGLLSRATKRVRSEIQKLPGQAAVALLVVAVSWATLQLCGLDVLKQQVDQQGHEIERLTTQAGNCKEPVRSHE